ncbi:MAG TPA: nucleotide pyrophosphohydrolase [Polyangia bacterium]|nr:nucleotide pyrophosphohydrolase [Polyangia bacterium]
MSMSWSDDTTALSTLKRRIAEFARARDWERYHTPKNLACATAAEAGELLELFLWQDTLPEGKRAQLEAEVADVAICLLNLCHAAGIDLAAAVERKISDNERKYPPEKVRGSAKKYDEYESGE